MYSSNNAIIASQGDLGASTNYFDIDPEAVATSTDVTLTVVDDEGATKEVTVTVTPATSSLALNPSSIDVYKDSSIRFFILGGTPNYRAYTTDPDCAENVPDYTFSSTDFWVDIPDDSSCNGASITITVEDSLGKTATATINIAGTTPTALAMNPASVDLTDGPDSQTFIFQVSGGLPSYNIQSSSPNVVFNDDGGTTGIEDNGIKDGDENGTWTVSTDGGIFTATVPANAVAADTTVTLTVTDSGGSPLITATLNITND
jgi:hypothetical protein